MKSEKYFWKTSWLIQIEKLKKRWVGMVQCYYETETQEEEREYEGSEV